MYESIQKISHTKEFSVVCIFCVPKMHYMSLKLLIVLFKESFETSTEMLDIHNTTIDNCDLFNKFYKHFSGFSFSGVYTSLMFFS